MNKTYALPTFISVVAYFMLVIGVYSIFAFFAVPDSLFGQVGLVSLVSFPFLLGFSKIVKAVSIYIDLHTQQNKQEKSTTKND